MIVMVFGVFDGLHEGHQYLLREATKQGSLVIVVARDSVVRQLKKKMPKQNELERIDALQKFSPAAIVILGDKDQGSYDVVKTHRPAMICLGYDQLALGEDLRRRIESGTIQVTKLYEISRNDLSKLQTTVPH